MTRDTLEQLQAFKGKHIINAIDEIKTLVGPHYAVNVMDPLFNLGPIDHDPRRLNVRTDEDSRITSFTIG